MPKAKDKVMGTVAFSEMTQTVEFAEMSDYPEGASAEAKRALKFKEENGSSCGTTTGWARARQLAARKPLSASDVKSIHSFLSRAKVYDQSKFTDEDGKEICGSIMYAAWGGDSMVKWAASKAEALKKESNSYSEIKVGDQTFEVNNVGEGELHLQGDKAYFMYRMLSETEVAVGSRFHSDFSEIKLSDYVDLAKGIPFLIDHNDYESTNAIGRVAHTFYSDDIDGTGIGGINGIIEIDTTLEYKGMSAKDIAKRIKMGYIYSGSVQIKYGFKPSHDVENFRMKVGSKTEEGEYIRKIATDIEKFYEFSGLAHGADTKAGLLNNTKESYINQIRSSFSESEKINMVLIPKTEQHSFGEQALLGNDDAQEYVDNYNTLSTSFAELKAEKEQQQQEHNEKVTEMFAEVEKANERLTKFKENVDTVVSSFNTILKDDIIEYNKKAVTLQSLGEEVETLSLDFEDLETALETVKKLQADNLQNKIDEALGLYKKEEKTGINLAVDNFEQRQQQIENLFG